MKRLRFNPPCAHRDELLAAVTRRPRLSHPFALAGLLAAVPSIAAQSPPGLPTPRGQGLSTPTPQAFVSDQVYHSSMWITPNGDPVYTGPMLARMLSAGIPGQFGGGDKVKVGLSSPIFYSRDTVGPFLADPARHMAYVINIESEERSLPLPPDVSDVAQLPVEVRHGPDGVPNTWDDLPTWANAAKCPRTVAALEWARFLNLPISFQMQAVGPQGGQPLPGGTQLDLRDLDAYIESLGKDQCMWNETNVSDPDDMPSTFDPANAGFGNFSFATPTLADPTLAAGMGYNLTYRMLAARNAQAACAQLIRLGNLDRYKGRIVALAIDPEVHMPAYDLVNLSRSSFEDYHPATIREFSEKLRLRYGDTRPGLDSNGDGRTFAGDYGVYYMQYTAGAPVPTGWSLLDAPRRVPANGSAPRDPYWHLWCNFLVGQIDGFLEQMVAAMVTGGIPADRVFTHQTLASSSYDKNRVRAPSLNVQWLDDWTHLESSYAQLGFSMYQPYGLLPGLGTRQFAYYENFRRRDENFGAPEFNPWIIQPHTASNQLSATLQQIRDIMLATFDQGGHVLWPHYWGADDHPVMDRIGRRLANAASRPHWVWTTTGSPTLTQVTSGQAWAWKNAVVQGGLAFKATAWPAYLESPALSIAAADFPCLGVSSIVHVATGNPQGVKGGDRFDAKVEFRTANGIWHTVIVPGLWTYETSALQDWGIDLSGHPSYSGTITGLRIHPVGHLNDVWAVLNEVTLCGPNNFTIAMKEMAVARNSTDRPELPATTPIDAPQRLIDLVTPGHADGRVVVYGNDPVDFANTPPNDYTDFALSRAGLPNFAPATVICGGIARSAIRSPAPLLIGQWRTGKFRRLQLPLLNNLVLRFGIGLEDGQVSTDGVRFRISLRDHLNRRLDVLFDKEHRSNAWTDHEVDLTPWAGKSVDLMFEVQAFADASGDRAAWSAPTIVSNVSQSRPWLASAGFSLQQGKNQWSYEQWNGSAHSLMTVDQTNNRWEGAQSTCLIASNWQHPEGNDSSRVWHAYRDGTVTITGPLSRSSTNPDGVVVSVHKNGTLLVSRIVNPGVSGSLSLPPFLVSMGDRIEFRVNRRVTSSFDTTNWDPSVLLSWYGGY